MRWRTRRHEPLTIELDFSTPADEVDFAHESERQFARLLDFYGIEWHYEPRSFPIEFDEDGEPAKYFTPDFYLAADDLFIEITTMSQKLVTKKNRKIRLLREHHPDVRCKIFPALPRSSTWVRSKERVDLSSRALVLGPDALVMLRASQWRLQWCVAEMIAASLRPSTPLAVSSASTHLWMRLRCASLPETPSARRSAAAISTTHHWQGLRTKTHLGCIEDEDAARGVTGRPERGERMWPEH